MFMFTFFSPHEGDIVVASIHWGGNWGYRIPSAHIAFAHALIDKSQVDVIHGHSSHHPIGLEVYKGKLVIYGCGDFINDYEGISGCVVASKDDVVNKPHNTCCNTDMKHTEATSA
jgi:poly-gamma-glutamate capsule biosynthesis protein CapA/YwtB (metallophosphatase superfamily)